MKSLVSLILILTFSTSTLASAGVPASMQVAQRYIYGEGPRAFRGLAPAKYSKAVVQKAIGGLYRHGKFAVDTEFGQVLVFTMTLACIDLVASQIATVYNNKIPDLATFERLAEESAVKVLGEYEKSVTSSDFVAGMSLGMVGTSVVKKPSSIMTTMLADAGGRKALVALLSRSIKTTATFVGWEFGSQLVSEARDLLDDPNDFRRSQQFGSVSLGALHSLLDPNAHNMNDRRLAGLMWSNVLQIAFVRKDLRDQWFNDTYRTRIMTGEFALMVSSMVAAGTIGTAVFPAAGTFAGIMFGVAGAGVYILVPQSIKDETTMVLKQVRLTAVQSSLEHNKEALKEALQARILKIPPMLTPKQYQGRIKAGQLRGISTPIPEAQRIASIERALADRQSLREDEVTIYCERMQLELMQFFKDEISWDLTAYRLSYDFAQIYKVYDDDSIFMQTLVNPAETDTGVVELLAKSALQIKDLQKYFNDLAQPLLETISSTRAPMRLENLSNNGQIAAHFLELVNAHGLHETPLFQKIEGL